MAEKMTSINPSILVWARQSSSTPLDEAYSKFGKEQLDAWENGRDYPTYSQLKAICDYYRKPVAICFFPEPPHLKNIPSSCRTLPSQLHTVFSRNLIKCIDEARIMQINLYELCEDNNPAVHLFTNSCFDTDDIRRTADQFRFLLQAPLEEQKRIAKLEDAFEYWRERFHSVGIYVFKNAFKDEAVSGFCLYDDLFPVIYVNNSFAISRQIFTLFHEAFHLIVKTSGIDIFDDTGLRKYVKGDTEKIERYCNQFAGKFLIPDDDFSKHLGGFPPTENDISTLASLYKVSREVVLRKFLDAGNITPDEYTLRSETYNADYLRFKKQKSDEKSGGNYYNTQATYKGRQYLDLAFTRYYARKISLVQLSKYLDMKISSLQSFAARKGWGSL